MRIDNVMILPTEDDIEDLNNGLSITTITTQGEEIALYPEAEVAG